jgi:hypothetical protein
MTPCHTSLAVHTQGESTTEWIGASVTPCGGSVTFTIERNGRVANVRGNPLRVPVRGAKLVRADWGNWCGPRRGLTVVVRYAALVRRVPARPLPLCLQPQQRSTLTAIR